MQKSWKRESTSKCEAWHEPCLFTRLPSVYLAATFLVFVSLICFPCTLWQQTTISTHCPARRCCVFPPSLPPHTRLRPVSTETPQRAKGPLWEWWRQSAKIIKNQIGNTAKTSVVLGFYLPLYRRCLITVSMKVIFSGLSVYLLSAGCPGNMNMFLKNLMDRWLRLVW